ncbi:MAG: hypothetical protein WA087_00605 [Candidatus Saccharimonadales bacterium]
MDKQIKTDADILIKILTNFILNAGRQTNQKINYPAPMASDRANSNSGK